MKETDPIKIEETNKLNEVLSRVESAKHTVESKLELIGKENLDKLADLRADPETGTDFDMMLDQLHEKNEALNLKDKFKRIEEYKYLLKNPYFARIDLENPTEPGSNDKLYIGKFGFTDKEPVVTDWRASIASIYYRYRFPQKNVEYKTELSTEKRDLLLKRTFDIHEGKLTKYYNNDIQFDENDIIVDKIQNRTGGVLEDIVETIQQDQMDIIESDPRQICIVQGCVGSGKSTVAIHKLAHIFFHFANYIHPEKSILIVKNQILVGYLATLFPKLGIFDINFKTFRDLVINAVFREGLPISIDLDKMQDTSAYPLAKIQEIYKHIESIHQLYAQKIQDTFTDPEFESYGGYKYTNDITPYDNLSDILVDLNEEVDSLKEEIKENPKSMRSALLKTNISRIRSLIRKINDLKYKLKNQVLEDVLKELNISTKSKLNYLETLVYLLVYSKLIGINKSQVYEYCVIDEGQDFSLLEFAILNNFVLRGRFGIFGDLNQGLISDGIRNWQDIKDVIPEAKKAVLYSLDTNYRSTRPIIDLANSIMTPYSNEFLPKSVNRSGSQPIQLQTKNTQELLQTFEEHIKNDMKNFTKTIGVICYDNINMQDVSTLLNRHITKDATFVTLDQTKKINYVPKGVYLMHVNDCKGLEFAKVYVLGLDLSKVDNIEDARKAFVSVTRAMNDLVILN